MVLLSIVFAPKGCQKYRKRASNPDFGYYASLFTLFSIFSLFLLFLSLNLQILFLVLDKVICPFLVKRFDMLIWHPTNEIMLRLDALMNAQVDRILFTQC
jgi:hypothetical protein